jgi:DNA helicase TIP49 (TBP-interacting protein)
LIGGNVVKVVLKVKNLGFVLNERHTTTDHFRNVLRPHDAHTSFEVRRRFVLSLILPHVNYGNIVFADADSASQRRVGVAFKACLRRL